MEQSFLNNIIHICIAMNWDNIRFFLEVSKQGTLSGAAKALKTSQPTVGRHIDRLEKELNAHLFERTPSGFHLTCVGERLFEQAKKINTEVLNFKDHSKQNEDELSGTVRVRFGELTSFFVASRMHDFRKKYPAIKIELSTTNRNVNMTHREADITLACKLPEHGDLITKKVVKYAHAIYGAKEYVQANPAAYTEQRFQKCDWISEQGTGDWTDDYDWLKAHLIGIDPVVYCRTFTAVTAALEGGAGLAIQAAYTAERNPNLVRVSPIIEELSHLPWLIAHKEALSHQRVRAVWDWLLDQYEIHRSAFENFTTSLPEVSV